MAGYYRGGLVHLDIPGSHFLEHIEKQKRLPVVRPQRVEGIPALGRERFRLPGRQDVGGGGGRLGRP
jgi:hypothetical protein